MSGADAKCVLVDTNVFVVAEGLHDGASDSCMLACVRLAEQIRDGLTLAVDSGDLIFNEYLSALHRSDTSGVGAKMVARLFRRRYTACRMVDLTPAAVQGGSFEEVPFGLRDFDLDDHKFIAVAVAAGNCPPIFTALDEEWWDRRPDFVASGIDVQFPCAPDLMDRG